MGGEMERSYTAYGRRHLGRARRVRLGGRPISLDGGELEPGKKSAWILVSEPPAGALVRLDPSSLKIEARFGFPSPQRVAVGAGAAWVAAADAVSRIDTKRNLVTASVSLGFEPTALVVDAEGVWAGGDGLVARIDPRTTEPLGVIELPSRPLANLALGAEALWASVGSELHRIDTRTNDVTGSVDVSDGKEDEIQDIAVRAGLVRVAVHSRAEPHRESYLALIDDHP